MCASLGPKLVSNDLDIVTSSNLITTLQLFHKFS